MKKHIAFILTSLILILSILEGSITSLASDQDECDFLINGVVSANTGCQTSEVTHEVLQDWVDTGLTEDLYGTGEWYVMALAHLDPSLDFSHFAEVLSEKAAADTHTTAVTSLKTSLTLLACKDSSNPYISATAASWYQKGSNSIMELVFGLHLMNNGYTASVSCSDVIADLLAFRRTDGGFSLNGDYGDSDVTAMVLQALSACSLSSASEVQDVINDGLLFLGNAQQPDGDFKSYGTANPESTAQVIMALTALGIDPLSDTCFIKDGTLLDGLKKYVCSDGSFSHTLGGASNGNATVQAFYSLVTLKSFYEGDGYFYKWDRCVATATPTPSEEKTPTGITPTPADALSTVTPSETPVSVTQTPAASPTSASVSAVSGISTFFADHGLTMLIASGIILLLFVLLLILRKLSKNNLIFLLILWLILLFAAAFIKITPVSHETADTPITAGPASDTADPYGTVTISITCHTIQDKESDAVPDDGIILSETTVYITEGASVYDVLSAVCKARGINCDAQNAGLVYVRGINNIYERDFGGLSGWMYFVNGAEPQVDCGSYILQPDDVIEWKYTTNIGEDLK